MLMPLEPFPSLREPLTRIQRVVSEKVNKFIVKKDINVNFVWIHVYKNTFFWTGFYIVISFLLLNKIYFSRHEVCFDRFTNKSWQVIEKSNLLPATVLCNQQNMAILLLFYYFIIPKL